MHAPMLDCALPSYIIYCALLGSLHGRPAEASHVSHRNQKCLDRPEQAVQQTQQASVRPRQTQCKHMQGGHSGGGIKSWDHPSQVGREGSRSEVSQAILIQGVPSSTPFSQSCSANPRGFMGQYATLRKAHRCAGTPHGL